MAMVNAILVGGFGAAAYIVAVLLLFLVIAWIGGRGKRG